MGGIIGGIGKLFGGSSAKTDRRETLNSYGELNNLYNYGVNQGERAQAQGQDLTGQAGAYFTKLLSGNRPAALQAISPVANSATAQADAQKRQIAQSGTARGGGVNEVGQSIDTNRQAAVDNALNQATAGAAGGAAGVGGTELADASRLLGLGETAAADTLHGSIESRPYSYGIHNDTAANAGAFTTQVLSDLFNPGPGGIWSNVKSGGA